MSDAAGCDNPAPAVDLLLVGNDLIFATRIRSTAKAAGLSTHQLADANEAAAWFAASTARGVFIDLNSAAGDAAALIEFLSAEQPKPRVVAFFSHVDAALGRAARQAKADEVLPRSAFHQRLATLLANLAAE